MTPRHARAAIAASLAVALLAAGCGSPTPVVEPARPRDLIVLATHPEDGALGAATVTTPDGASVPLTQANEGVRVRLGSPPSTPAIVPADEVLRIFGDALAALPPPAKRYLLYFELGSDTLTPESRALVPEILTTVQGRTSPDVSVIGHTDSTGAAAANVDLGLRRATLVRDLLVAAGLDAALVELTSHGESNPIVATPDNTNEARNRRVEVTVR